MPRYIIKLEDKKFKVDYYLEWSTIVDAPVTYGMSLEDFKLYYEHEYGQVGKEGLPARMHRVEGKGVSSEIDDNVMDLIRHNRAGKNESTLTHEMILENYCRHWYRDGVDLKHKSN